MKREAINPWPWSLDYGYNQAELVTGPARVLYCSGQTSIDSDGKPCHLDDMRSQIDLAMRNLESVLDKSGMTLANVVRLRVYTTDVDLMVRNYDVLTARFAAAGIKPAQTLLGISRLAFPGLLVEIEATAVA